jgi:hypothetical protein
MALVWDKAHLGERRWLRAKPLHLRIGSRTVRTNTINAAVAVGFTGMGVLVIGLAGSPDMTRGTDAQYAAGAGLTRIAGRVLEFVDPLPEPLLGMGLLALVGVFVWATLREPSTRRTGDLPGESGDSSAAPAECHASDQRDHAPERAPR